MCLIIIITTETYADISMPYTQTFDTYPFFRMRKQTNIYSKIFPIALIVISFDY